MFFGIIILFIFHSGDESSYEVVAAGETVSAAGDEDWEECESSPEKNKAKGRKGPDVVVHVRVSQ